MSDRPNPLVGTIGDAPVVRMTIENVKRGMEIIRNMKPGEPRVILSRRQYAIAQDLIKQGRDPLSAALEAQCR